jgi:addiction module HigA family antidote
MTSKRRQPTSPGEILHEEYLVPLGLTQKALADHVGCDIKVINRIVNGRTSVTAVMALRLAASFGTAPEFWLNAQEAVDLWRAEQSIGELPEPIRKAG